MTRPYQRFRGVPFHRHSFYTLLPFLFPCTSFRSCFTNSGSQTTEDHHRMHSTVHQKFILWASSGTSKPRYLERLEPLGQEYTKIAKSQLFAPPPSSIAMHGIPIDGQGGFSALDARTSQARVPSTRQRRNSAPTAELPPASAHLRRHNSADLSVKLEPSRSPLLEPTLLELPRHETNIRPSVSPGRAAHMQRMFLLRSSVYSPGHEKAAASSVVMMSNEPPRSTTMKAWQTAKWTIIE